MVYETDNAESRIGQTQETLTNGDHLVSEAYQGMAASAKQSRIERQPSQQVVAPDFLVMTSPYGDLLPTPAPRTDRAQPVPAPEIHWDHEASRRAGERGDEIARERLDQASRRRSGGGGRHGGHRH